MSRRPSTRALVVTGIVLSLLVAGVLSWYAASSPDGLQRVAEDQGFSQTSERHPADDSPFAGYGTKGLGDGRLSGGLAGVVGVVATGLVMGGLVLVLRRRSRRPDATDDLGTEVSATETSDTQASRTEGPGSHDPLLVSKDEAAPGPSDAPGTDR